MPLRWGGRQEVLRYAAMMAREAGRGSCARGFAVAKPAGRSMTLGIADKKCENPTLRCYDGEGGKARRLQQRFREGEAGRDAHDLGGQQKS
mmetsp:Transcript_23963/g.41017  ORF Transcript_23963/g.41017 Transcript_23963/m.41017 type:complete len:91 (+) Transcript_23963:375-647(+)